MITMATIKKAIHFDRSSPLTYMLVVSISTRIPDVKSIIPKAEKVIHLVLSNLVSSEERPMLFYLEGK